MTIYFIQAGETGPIKIGYTSGTAAGRMIALQTCSPFKLRCLGEVYGGPSLEGQVHAHLAEFRTCGEWFAPEDAVHETLEALQAGTFSPAIELQRPAEKDCSPPSPRARGSATGLRIDLPSYLADAIRAVARRDDIDPRDLAIDALHDIFGCIEPATVPIKLRDPTGDELLQSALLPFQNWAALQIDRQGNAA